MLDDIKRNAKKKMNGILIMNNASAHTTKLTLFWFSKHFRVKSYRNYICNYEKNIQDSKTQNLKELNLLLKKV